MASLNTFELRRLCIQVEHNAHQFKSVSSVDISIGLEHATCGFAAWFMFWFGSF